ncbi:small lysine-rich protein 1 [Grammomys surdaster]|uniref:small lysine-rich protein 1 n=1 Tax=Grammomys surdaster TaxID=491861 RepID=UPI00109F0B29|nr:small lysine-rich protein 1 [Grammomys surdaster]
MPRPGALATNKQCEVLPLLCARQRAVRVPPREWGEPSLAYQHLRLRTPRRRPIGGAATAGAGGNSPAGKGKKGKGRSKTSGKKQKQKKPEADILSPAAMLNLYYIAHNVADCLYLRGFPWPGAPKGKKGKK